MTQGGGIATRNGHRQTSADHEPISVAHEQKRQYGLTPLRRSKISCDSPEDWPARESAILAAKNARADGAERFVKRAPELGPAAPHELSFWPLVRPDELSGRPRHPFTQSDASNVQAFRICTVWCRLHDKKVAGYQLAV